MPPLATIHPWTQRIANFGNAVAICLVPTLIYLAVFSTYDSTEPQLKETTISSLNAISLNATSASSSHAGSSRTHEKRMRTHQSLYSHSGTSNRLATSPTPARPPSVLALAFFGMLPRFYQEKSSDTCKQAGVDVLAGLVLPALRDLVLRTALRPKDNERPARGSGGFDAFHVYAHTFDTATIGYTPSSCDLRTTVLSALHEAFESIDEVAVRALTVTHHASALAHPHIQALRRRYNEAHSRRHTALLSMERAVSLLSEPGGTAVLLLRWDCIFFAPTAFHKLNYALLYRANWCTARSAGASGGGCYTMSAFASTDCGQADQDNALSDAAAAHAETDTPGAPDYWFAGNATSMRLFVGGAGAKHSVSPNGSRTKFEPVHM